MEIMLMTLRVFDLRILLIGAQIKKNENNNEHILQNSQNPQSPPLSRKNRRAAKIQLKA
jgi:hypothetical protein